MLRSAASGSRMSRVGSRPAASTKRSCRERAWASFRDDPEWQQVRAASEVDGPLTTRITNALWAPTDFSPLQ